MNSLKGSEVSHPEMSLVRLFRIEAFERAMKRALIENDSSLVRKLEKEIEIQKCYLQIGT